jgi:long-subunit acyl-CoA synthetase (AMP-forming)
MTGVLLPGLEARIVKDDGVDAEYGESGELWMRGKTIALCYWKNENATKDTFVPGGWLRTGDRFTMDEAGRFLCV